METLSMFFAVTATSIYRVVAEDGKGRAFAEKIALKGESKFPVGHKIEDGMMIAIARCLQAYIPEGHSWLSSQTSFERRLEDVHSSWWRTGTSPIVALFLSEEAAQACFEQPDLVPCDPRWIDQTKEVLASVGEEHPTISVCHYPKLALIC